MIERFAGRYALLRTLGEGGMGQVHLARDLSTGAECAIKRLRAGGDEASPETLRREFEALTQIRHPSVVAVHHYSVTADGEPYLVMEYVPGMPADRIVAPGDWRTACVVAAEVASGLEALHRAGVIHGDLKPRNVLVLGSPAAPDTAASVRLLDFGLAALRKRVEAGHRGTPGFAAPEVVRGEEPSPSSDLYGLGATLFALLTGEPPFGGATGEERLRAQQAGAPSSTRLENSGAPPALTELVLRLLAPEASERPENARAVRRALEHIHSAARRTLAERLRTAVLVGRERELARIERWRLAPADGPRLAFLEGDAGAGKSSILSEVAARAALRAETVFHLSCATLESPGAIARAITRAMVARASEAAARAPEERAAHWLAGDAPLAEADLEGVVQAAAAAAAAIPVPILVLLDDAERLERSSAAWLRRVALHASATRMQWVLARRRSEVPAEEERVLLEAGLAIRIELGPLSPADVERLAAARLHGPVPPELLEFLVRHGGGHPGFTVELLLSAAGRGAIEEAESGIAVRSDRLERVAEATSFENAVLDRLSHEDESSRAALAALAACGAPLTAPELEAVAPGTGTRTLDRLLAIGCVARDENGRLALRPPTLADTLWQAMDPERRAALGALALALPGLPRRQRYRLARDLGDLGAALAHAETSFAEAPEPRFAAEVAALAAPRDTVLAARWHDRAAQAWRARGRYAEVRTHLEKALAIVPAAPERGARWVLLSTAVLRTGAPAEVENVVARALEEGLAPSERAQLLVNRAASRAQAGDAEGDRRDAAEALSLAEACGDPITLGLAAEVTARRLSESGDLEAAEAMMSRAAEAFRNAENAHGIVRSIAWRAILARQRFRFDEAEGLLLEAIEAARRLPNRLALSEVVLALSGVRVEAGRWAESREPCEEAVRIALEDGRPAEAAASIANVAQIEGLLGHPREARRRSITAVRLCRGVRPDLETFSWRSLAQAERIRGRLVVANRAARRALRRLSNAPPGERGWTLLEMGKILAAQGRWKEARALADRPLPRDPEHDTLALSLLRILSGRAALRGSEVDVAVRRAEEVERGLRHQSAPYTVALLDVLRAEIAFSEHRSGDALTAGRRALAALAALPAPAERARAALDLATLATPAAGLREAITEWTQIAVRNFERLGDHRGRERSLALALEWQRLPAPVAISMSARESGLLERVSWLLHSLTDLDELSRRAMQAAVEQLDAERGVLLLTDPETGQLQPMAEHGAVEAATRSDAVRYSRRVAHQVTESGGSLLIQDAPSDPRAASESVMSLKLRSILCVPMFLAGRTVGAVYLDDSRRSHAFGDAERGLLEGFAHLMAVAIENSRGHQEVRREKERLEGENLSLRREVGSRMKAQGMIGSSAAMQKVLSMMEHAARSNATVLITGENGTGKELIARSLHHGGRRHSRPFVEVNCGAIPETLIEAELFGILANVATGVRARSGHFALAHGGTLMLDEIGEAAPHAQVALLSAIANREITPVGGGKPLAVDVRIIAATNRDLRRLIEQGRFREDLFYRLNVIEIEVPPLRDRKADLPALVQHFLRTFAGQQEREVPDLSNDFLAVLMQSDWPGNVRELQNYIERVMAMTPGRVLRPDPPPRDIENRGASIRLPRARRLPDAVTEIELRLIREALQKARGNQSEAARELGLTEQAVRYRLKKYRITQARQNPRSRHN